MKSFKLNIAFFAMFAMIFTSCSKEEAGLQNMDSDTASLSFGALLNDLTTNRASTKAHLGFLEGVPECSEGIAAYVEIILSLDGVNVVGDDGEGNAYRVDLVEGQLFTEEDAELELAPGNYSLDYFAVFTADGTRIWLAPMGGGDDDNLSNFVDNPLPIAIDLNAGVKKYVEVDVLCYDDRFVNEYGYLFFEIDKNEAIKFCIFGNYCDEAGRHYPASYSVNIWSGDSSSGTVLYTGVTNVTGTYDNGDFYAEPLCFALPDTEGEDQYYLEIILLNSDAYGNVTEEVIRAGVMTDGDVRALYSGDTDTEYYHFREGNCNLGDMPDLLGDDPDNGNGPDSDGDGVPDSIDECPNTPSVTTVDALGCPVECDDTDSTADCDSDGILNRCDMDNPNYDNFDCDNDTFINSEDSCPNTSGVTGGTGGDGCPVDSGCIDSSGIVLTFNETVDVSEFPVGTNPFYPLLLDGEQVGVITFELTVGTEELLIVSVDMFDGTEENQFTEYTVTTAELTLITIDDDPLCVENIDANEFDINWDRDNVEPLNYPLEVIFRANILISME